MSWARVRGDGERDLRADLPPSRRRSSSRPRPHCTASSPLRPARFRCAFDGVVWLWRYVVDLRACRPDPPPEERRPPLCSIPLRQRCWQAVQTRSEAASASRKNTCLFFDGETSPRAQHTMARSPAERWLADRRGRCPSPVGLKGRGGGAKNISMVSDLSRPCKTPRGDARVTPSTLTSRVP